MFKRPRLIAFIVLVLVVLVVLSLPGRTVAQLKLAIGGLFLPLFGLKSSTLSLADKAGNAWESRQTLLRRIEQLRSENQRLRLRLMQSEETFQENNRLRPLVGFQKQTLWNLKPARVVGREPANWWRTVIIDVGSRDGVRASLPVVTADGLVGRIANAGFNQSQVVLVGDPNCLVAALVQETRDAGIIEPRSSAAGDPALVDLTHLSRNTSLQPGHKVFTSGLGGIYPRGIFIGEIVDAQLAGYGLYTVARVKLAVNLNRLEEVWVILP